MYYTLVDFPKERALSPRQLCSQKVVFLAKRMFRFPPLLTHPSKSLVFFLFF